MTKTKTEPVPTGLQQILADESLSCNITSHFVKEARQAGFTALLETLHPDLISALGKEGIDKLYEHQRQAFELISSRKNTLISTGVASGKSLCYQLPLLNHYLKDTNTRALFLFPTKALAQDQKKSLQELVCNTGNHREGVVGVYDGDLPAGQRNAIRRQSAFVFSNPDMLHLGILPHHTRWADFFKNLKYVVVDEVHVYRGIFGSHFANVLRRFKRIAKFYNADPSFIVTSATLTGGRDFVEKLFEAKFSVVENDRSPHGKTHFLIYNPPLINRDLGIRRPASEETLRIARKLLPGRGQTLIFAHTRKRVELLLTELQTRSGEKELIFGYRSGYLPNERREIERKLRSGEIRIVVATNALELGIDIGGMDTVIMNGYPGSISSLRQQAGRAGRKGSDALAIFVASADLMDQYLVKHPDYLLKRNPEMALINPDNPYILLNHLQCAAFEKTFGADEPFGDLPAEKVREFFQLLEQIGKVHPSQDAWYWSSEGYPASEISLRTAAADTYVLQTEDTVVGIVDRNSAFWFTHPGAVYLHNGEPYLVKELNLEQNRVYLQPTNLAYYTQAISDISFELLEAYGHAEHGVYERFFGQLKVETRVTGYKKLKWSTRELLGREELDLPPTELVTHGCWFAFGKTLVGQLKQEQLWNNEANQYGPNWPKLSSLIRERDHHRCTNCGRAEVEGTFHVHHKLPFKSFGSAELANHPENLVTLCPSCHSAAEKQVYIQSGLAGLSHLLGRLAPFFLMCSGTDIHVFGEVRSLLANEQPALIFYDSAPGGVGLSEKLYTLLMNLFAKGREVVRDCGCKSGCPACVGPVAENGVGAKAPVKQMLKYLLEAAVPLTQGKIPAQMNGTDDNG